MGGIAQAFGDNIPILYLPGGPALNQYAVRPDFSPVRTFQTVSKYGEVIVQADQVASVMRRPFQFGRAFLLRPRNKKRCCGVKPHCHARRP